MSDEHRIDPEVLALLHEVAEDPAARYFEGLRARGPVFADQLQATSVATIDLTKAERQLVAVHREELAWILRMAARRENLENPNARDRFHRWKDDRRRVEIPSRDRWEKETTRWLQSPLGASDDLSAAITLVRAYMSRRLEERMAERLARAAIEVAPSDTTRIQLGLSLILSGRTIEALATLSDLLRWRPRDGVSSLAWEVTGLAESFKDKLATLAAYRESCRMHSYAPCALMAWLTWACLYGDEDEVLDAAGAVDAAPEESVNDYVLLIQRQLERGEWSPTPRAARMARDLQGRIGQLAHRVLDVQIGY